MLRFRTLQAFALLLITAWVAPTVAPASQNGSGSCAAGFAQLASRKVIHKTYALDAAYVGEDAGKTIDGMGFRTIYLRTPEERAEYRIRIQNGIFVNANGRPVDSQGGFHLFVMDPDGNLYASTRYMPGRFHHSSFLAGEPVAAAGIARFNAGKLERVDNQSGHYRPDGESLERLLQSLRAQGYDHSDVKVVAVPAEGN